jgi:hypothetical protein
MEFPQNWLEYKKCTELAGSSSLVNDKPHTQLTTLYPKSSNVPHMVKFVSRNLLEHHTSTLKQSQNKARKTAELTKL